MSEFVERFKKIHPAIRYLVVVLIVVMLVLIVLYLLIPPIQFGVFSNVLTMPAPGTVGTVVPTASSG